MEVSENLHGITFKTNCIVIKMLPDSMCGKAATFFICIHELAHYLQRIDRKTVGDNLDKKSATLLKKLRSDDQEIKIPIADSSICANLSEDEFARDESPGYVVGEESKSSVDKELKTMSDESIEGEKLVTGIIFKDDVKCMYEEGQDIFLMTTARSCLVYFQ